MSKTFTIIKREYKESVYKKSFIIITLLAPVLMLSFVFIPMLMTNLETEDAYKITVADYSGIVYQKLESKMDLKLKDGSKKYLLTQSASISTGFTETKDKLKDQVLAEEIDGFIHIPATIIDSSDAEYYAKNVSNFDINRQIRNSINSIVTDYRLKRSGLDPELINNLTEQIDLKTVKVQKGAEEKEGGFLEEYFTALSFVLILYITILMYGATIMRGVIEEKNSRVVEILLSSANSFQLMLGKIVGLGSVGLTQYLIWGICGVLLTVYGSIFTGGSTSLLNFSPIIFLYFIIFFVLGYFLFATLYATVGAMTNNDREAQQVSMPITLFLVVPLLMLAFITKNPDSTLAVTLSLIPFFSPIIMFLRIVLASPSPIEIGGSILILILTIFLMVWITSKIYRIGILMYGKKPTLPELLKWVRTK